MRRVLLAFSAVLVFSVSCYAGFGINLSHFRIDSISNGIGSALQWLVTNAINLTAAVGDDITNSSSSDTYARVYDDTNGLAIAQIPAGVPVSEGMRASWDTDEGATLGSELVDSQVAATWAAYGTNTVEDDGDEVKITHVDNTLGGGLVFRDSVATTENLTVGAVYELTGYARVNSGSVQLTIGNTSEGTVTVDTITATSLTPFSVTFEAANDITVVLRLADLGAGEIMWVSGVSLKKVTPAWLNSVSAADSTLLHPAKTGSKGETIFLEHDARANAESILSEAYRRTPSADPHHHYYQNQTLASPATTSLVAPLRDSEGRIYEELVRNGGFDVDAEWALNAGWSITGGQLVGTSGNTSDADMGLPFESGKTYKYVIDVDSCAAGLWALLVGVTNVTGYTSDTGIVSGTFTTEFDSVNLYKNSTGTPVFNSISIFEVDANGNPTNVLDGGRRESQTNLLTYSEDFRDTTDAGEARPWIYSNAAIGADSIAAPDGETTADTLSDDSSTGTGAVTVAMNTGATISTSTTHALSLFAKAKQLDFLYFELDGFTTPATNTRAYFDLTNGSLGTVDAGFDGGAVIEDAGNGWYRCSAIFTTDATDNSGTIRFGVAGADATPTVDLDGTSDIYLWGAMLHEGMGPSDRPAFEYIKTTTGSVQENENVDESVLWGYGGKYNNTGLVPFILNEPASTNSILYSEQLDNAYWTKTAGVTISADAVAGPDGETTADKIIEANSTTNHRVSRSGPNLVSGQTVTFSVKVKAAELGYAQIGIVVVGDFKVQVFDLSDGSKGASGTAGSTNITGVRSGSQYEGGGWWRIWISVDTSGSTAGPLFLLDVVGTNSTSTWAGDGTKGLYAVGAQAEYSMSAPTSYIPTTTGTVQRNATDFESVQNIPSQNFALRFRNVMQSYPLQNNYLIGFGDLTDGVTLFRSSGNGTSIRCFVSGLVFDSSLGATVFLDTLYSFGLTYIDGTFQLYLDGEAKDSFEKTVNLEQITGAAIGKYFADSNHIHGGINDLQIYTGSDLAAWASDTTWDDPE